MARDFSKVLEGLSKDDLEQLKQQTHTKINTIVKDEQNAGAKAFKEEYWDELQKWRDQLIEEGAELVRLEGKTKFNFEIELTLELSSNTENVLETNYNHLIWRDFEASQVFSYELTSKIKGDMPRAVKSVLQEQLDGFCSNACKVSPTVLSKLENLDLESSHRTTSILRSLADYLLFL